MKTLNDFSASLAVELVERKFREHAITLTAKDRKRLQKAIVEERDLASIRLEDWQVADTTIRSIDISPTTKELEEIAIRRRAALAAAAAAIPEIVAERAVAIERRLHANWAREAERQQLAYGQFSARLRKLWRKPLASLLMLITMCREFGAELNAQLRTNIHDEKNPATIEVLTRLLARACQVAAEVHTLLEHGFANGAMARWRTIYEIAVTAAFISKSGEAIAERFLAHDVVGAHKSLELYVEHQVRLGLQPLPDSDLNKTRQAYQHALAIHGAGFGSDYGWAIPGLPRLTRNRATFADIVEEVDMRHMGPYYKLACNQVHAAPRGLFFALGLGEESSALLTGPSTCGLADPGQNTALSLMLITIVVAELYTSVDVVVLLSTIERVGNLTMQQFASVDDSGKVKPRSKVRRATGRPRPSVSKAAGPNVQ